MDYKYIKLSLHQQIKTKMKLTTNNTAKAIGWALLVFIVCAIVILKFGNTIN